MNNRGIIKVIDITGKMDNYMTLEEFMNYVLLVIIKEIKIEWLVFLVEVI